MPSLINIIGLGLQNNVKKIILFTGNVLGIGINWPLYDNKRVIRLTAIDPSEDTWKKCTIDTKS
jgi:hypothetical protein